MKTPPLTKAEQLPHYQDLHFALIGTMQDYEAKTGWNVTSLSFTATPGTSELNITTEPGQ
jgi:hypothetical protein